MTPDELQQHAKNLILSHARDVEFLSIVEYLGDEEIDDQDDTIAKAIDALIADSTVSVDWPGESYEDWRPSAHRRALLIEQGWTPPVEATP